MENPDAGDLRHQRLQQDGWKQVRMKGSHRQFKHAVKIGRVKVRSASKLAPPDAARLRRLTETLAESGCIK